MRICIATLHTQEIAIMANATIPNKTAYAQKHNYTLVVIPHRVSSRHPSWDKILVIERLLPMFDWCLWTDSDCIFNNFSKKLEAKLTNDGVFIRDPYSNANNKDKQLINSGVFALRNCDKSKNLLDSVWLEGNENLLTVDKRSYSGWPWEQGALCKQIVNNNGFVILDDMDMNCHPSMAKPDTHIIHYMGWRTTQETENAAIADIARRNQVIL